MYFLIPILLIMVTFLSVLVIRKKESGLKTMLLGLTIVIIGVGIRLDDSSPISLFIFLFGFLISLYGFIRNKDNY